VHWPRPPKKVGRIFGPRPPQDRRGKRAKERGVRFGKPEKTAETLRGGWLHSGDAGVMDRNGYLTVRGRFAELITVTGRTWFPRDVEEALCAQPNVKEAALVALPDAKLGQRPVAYVTLTDGAADLDKLKAAIAPLVPYDLTAMTVKSLAAFPMTPTGKIAKAQLRESALAGDGAQEFPRSSN